MKKINSIIIMFTLIFSSIFPMNIRAEEKSEVLTYEEAVKIALLNSLDMRNAEREGDKASEMGRSLELSTSGVKPTSTGQGINDFKLAEISKGIEKVDVAKTGAQKKQELIKETISYGIKSCFLNIQKNKSQLEFLDAQIKNGIGNNRIVRLKNEQGMESNLTYKQSELSIEKLQKDREKTQKDLEAEYIKLSKLMGTSNLQRPNLENIPVKYEELKDRDSEVDYRASRAIEESVSIWAKEQEAYLKQRGLDLYVFNVNDPKITLPGLGSITLSGMAPKQDPYSVQELDIAISGTEADKMKNDLTESIRSTYNNIKKLEDIHRSLEVDKETVDELYKALKVKYEVGMATKQELEDLELKKKQVESGLYQVETQHSLLVELYENPKLSSFLLTK